MWFQVIADDNASGPTQVAQADDGFPEFAAP